MQDAPQHGRTTLNQAQQSYWCWQHVFLSLAEDALFAMLVAMGMPVDTSWCSCAPGCLIAPTPALWQLEQGAGL
jgi:hypothetical protein